MHQRHVSIRHVLQIYIFAILNLVLAFVYSLKDYFVFKAIPKMYC
jgi:hypothetical protein